MRFPADHGPHPGFRNEWWYFTGNLYTDSGRRFGFQWTFFRRQQFVTDSDLAVTSSVNNAWEARDLFMAHFALSDIENGQFYFQERFGRPGAGIAGIDTQPLRLWLDDWSLSAAPTSLFPLALQARDRQRSLQLELQPLKPLVLQGDRGLSQKSAEPGNASYYYSFTRLAASGELQLNGLRETVSGTAWLDREWSTSALGAGQVGWDWFALQFDDGYDLMFYQLRRDDGSIDQHSKGIVVDPRGNSAVISSSDMRLEPVRFWQSPAGSRYPVSWRYQVEQGDFLRRGEIHAALDAQWLAASVSYWEGAVDVSDDSGKRQGVGYLEMTGY